MTLKWMAVIVGVVAATLCITANVVVDAVEGGQVPALVNIVTITTTGSATILAVVAELHDRIDTRLTALTEFLVARLNEMDSHAGDHHAGFVEGYLLGQGQDAAVVPIGPRMHGRRMMIGSDD